MENAVGRICQVDISAEDGFYLYDVTADCSCRGFELYLSSSGDPAPGYRLKAESDWFDFTGQARVDQKMVEGYNGIYLYLLDPNTNLTSEIVEVYTQEARLKGWYLTEDGMLVFQMDRRGSAWRMSSKILLSCEDPNGILCTYEIPLSAARIPLEAVGLWKDALSFTFSLQYIRENQAIVFSASTGEITIPVAAPKVDCVTFDGGVFAFTGDFYKDAAISAELWENGGRCETVRLTVDHKLAMEGTGLEPGAQYGIRLWYEHETGHSLKGEVIPVAVTWPRLKACRFSGNFAVLEVEGSGCYEVKPDAVRMEEGRIYMPKETMEAALRRKLGRARGPERKIAVEAPGYYQTECAGHRLYFFGTRPDQLDMGKDAIVRLPKLPGIVSAYEGKCFKLAVESNEAWLIIKKERYGMSQEELRQDYNYLCLALSGNEEALCLLQQAVAENLPMRAEEFLYYNYRFAPEEGYTDLVAGMSLLAESFDYLGKDSGSPGGSSSIRYPLVRREQELVISPFAKQMEYMTPLTSQIFCDSRFGQDSVFTGIGGIASPYLRLAYPKLFARRSESGVCLYRGNFCLLAAEAQSALIQAVADLREGPGESGKGTYHCFLGHDSVSAQIHIKVDKKGRWVPLGTCLKDILAEDGAERAVLYRRAKGSLYPVAEPEMDMPLLIGDCIEIAGKPDA